MGLSGWFFEYPFLLMLVIFLLLSFPLILILLESTKAPKWDIAGLWLKVILMALHTINGFLFPMSSEVQSVLRSEELLVVVLILLGIVSISLGWAIVRKQHIRKSVRFRCSIQPS